MSFFGKLFFIVLLIFAPLAGARSQSLPALEDVLRSREVRDRMNENVVGIITGSPTGKYMPLGADLARVLDDRRTQELRLVVSVGYGSVQNVDDLLNLRGIDLAMVQADVLDAFRRVPAVYQTLRRQMRYVTRLHHEEIHVLGRGGIATMAGLDRKRVAIGLPSSGIQVTARNLFDHFGIKPQEVPISDKEALPRLLAGELDAMVYVVGRGAAAFRGVPAEKVIEAGLAFVPFPVRERLFEPYEASTLTSENYPALIPPGATVPVAAVPSVLAVFGWKPDQPRYRPVRLFVERLFERIGDLARTPGTEQDLWCQVDIAAPMPGWERFSVAADWLARNRGRPSRGCDGTTDRDRGCYERFLAAAARDGARITDRSEPWVESLYAGWRAKSGSDCPADLVR